MATQQKKPEPKSDRRDSDFNHDADPMQKGGSGKLGWWDGVGGFLDNRNPFLDNTGAFYDDAQFDELQKASDRYNIPLPELQKLALKNPEWQQDLEAQVVGAGEDVKYKDTPLERAQAQNMEGTAFDNVRADPRLKDQQFASLNALKELADNGGMNGTDKANLARTQSDVAQADRGRRDAVMQGMARRGMGGSGMELLAQLQSNQAATDRAAQQGLDINGMAQQRALDAMMQGGQLAGSIRGQDFGEQARIAQARDAIAQFNAQNTTSNNQFNAGQANGMSQFDAGNRLRTDMYKRDTRIGVDTGNANRTQSANQFNIGGRQDVANQGVANDNKATTYNSTELPQKQFDNNKILADAQAGRDDKNAAFYSDRSDDAEKERQNKIKGVGQVVGSVISAVSDERAKKDKRPVQDIDLDMFLSTIQPKKFKYKDPSHGEGDRTGVMAQDLLKSALGRDAVIQDEDGTLGYDTTKMQGIMLAALKHLSNKIDKKG